MKNMSNDVRPGMKEPMQNAKTPLSNPKYSPNGSGAGKSEGPIGKDEKNVKFPDCGSK